MMKLISRRSFLTASTLGSAALLSGLSFRLLASEGISILTILHSNDTHSRIDPYPENDPKFPGMGGYALRAAYINQIRKEKEHVLLLDAGDIFQGTPYFNVYGGEPELKLMTQMDYDAATIGNHEFDNGLEAFDNVMAHAGFPFISSNYDFSDTLLNGKISEYQVIKKGDIKVGIYGLGVELDGLVGRNLYKNTQYLDPLNIALKMENRLKNDLKCDIIVCLSHLGYQYETDQISDIKLAPMLLHTDLILGGHTHTLLENPVEIVSNTGKKIHIGQTGYGGVRIGRIDIYIDQESKEMKLETAMIKISKSQVV